MLRWIANWAARYAPTVEQQAQKALPELRLELFQAEQRILDAQVHADYYRARLAFCESVLKNGIEQVSDKRKEPETAVATLRSGPQANSSAIGLMTSRFTTRRVGCYYSAVGASQLRVKVSEAFAGKSHCAMNV